MSPWILAIKLRQRIGQHNGVATQNDENDQHYEESQAVDTSDADIGANSARKRRQGQLDLTAAKKKAAEQPTGSRLDASGDCSTTIGGGSSTATGIGQCVTAANSDCDPPNSCAGWTVVEERRREQKAQYVAKVNANMAKSARMPTFAKKDEHRVVVRPRGGLVVSATKMSVLRAAIITAANIKIEEAEDDSFAPNAAQNIIVLSTPSEARSFRYGSIRSITVEERTYETFAYKSTPDNTSRGVISGVGREEPEEQITRFLVNKHNPTVMAAHRLGNTESVVILFEGNKVPHYVKYGGFVTKCTLYRQHREVCTTCGQIGHRKDVCPTPNAKVCFACGRNNPREDHAEYCKPRCKLCGGSHITGAGSCKNKFKTPLQIKQRQWAKQNTEAITKMAPPQMAPAPAKEPGKVTLSRRFDFPELRASGTRHEQNGVASRDRSRAEPEDAPWADVTSGRPKEARPPRPEPQVQAHPSPTNKSDVNRAAMTQKSGAPSGAAAATPKEPGKMPSGSSCSEQCKKETRELKATGEARDEANDNKMTTDADEKDNGTLANIAGNAFANTTTPETFQFTAKATIPTRASIVAAARGLSKKIGQNARAIQKWGKSFEGLEQRILTKCTQVIQQQLAQTIQLQIEQALERALSPEKLQPLLDSRLSSTAAGRRLLDRVGLLPPGERPGAGPDGEPEEQVPLSDEAARKIIRLVRSIVASRAACGAAAGPTIALKWFPAHMGRQLAPDIENRNEEADAVARDLITCRTAAARPPETSGEEREEDLDPLTDYGGILAAYREARRAFPPPHHELSRAEAVQLRQLQTECVLTPALARHVCPDMFVDAKCSVCERELATLRHIMWGGCNSAVHNGNGQCQDATYPKEVGAWIRSEDSTTQRRAIQRLEEALAKQKRKGADAPDDGSGGARVSNA
ncbi:hypothetical protein HPB49_007055 [Dermacentor silvarum]|uniref:Uncharacterized protein n=1 Tax=Dermacentor silvarum TaxID=543639 RepID=A0ACB8D380_DERSI|nr:hypothetical protein HPB49_007055 [Dermacentor silvarum]